MLIKILFGLAIVYFNVILLIVAHLPRQDNRPGRRKGP